MGARLNSLYSEEKPPFAQAMDGFMRESNYRAQRPAFATRLLWWYQQQYDRDIGFIRKFAKELIDARRNNPTETHDILNAMIKGCDPKTGRQMSEESLIDNMVTFLIAGMYIYAMASRRLLIFLLQRCEILSLQQQVMKQRLVELHFFSTILSNAQASGRRSRRK